MKLQFYQNERGFISCTVSVGELISSLALLESGNYLTKKEAFNDLVKELEIIETILSQKIATMKLQAKEL